MVTFRQTFRQTFRRTFRPTHVMPLSTSVILKILTLLSVTRVTTSIPEILVTSAQLRCVNVEAPKDTVLIINYEAPDLVTELTHEYYGPTQITAMVQPSDSIKTFANLKMLNRTQKLLREKESTMKHTMELDGVAAICIQAHMASANYPMRFGLFVSRDNFVLYNDPEEPRLDSEILNDSEVKGHLSQMELEMRRINIAMKSILTDADFSKERDAVFHKQTASMHSATMFWPILQICVLIMTGFAQANHITHFFRSRRII